MKKEIKKELESLNSSLKHENSDGFITPDGYFDKVQDKIIHSMRTAKKPRIFGLKRIIGIAASVCLILIARSLFIVGDSETYTLSDPALLEYLEEYEALTIDELTEIVSYEDVWLSDPEEDAGIDEFYDEIDITDLEDIIL